MILTLPNVEHRALRGALFDLTSDSRCHYLQSVNVDTAVRLSVRAYLDAHVRSDITALESAALLPRGRHMAAFLLWMLLLVFCWPLALLALVMYPIVWLLCLPLRLVGITVGAVFAFLGAVLMLPARVLRGRPA
jgi:hypothetical protein